MPAVTVNLEHALEVARKAARVGAEVALHHFHKGVTVEHKADASPVSVADRETEVAVLQVLREAFPDYAVLAEESGSSDGSAGASDTRWIVDPIDGTRGYVRGGSNWGQLIALESGGETLLGVIHVPLRDEHCYAARGLGAFRNDVAVSAQDSGSELDKLTLSIGETKMVLAAPRTEAMVRLIDRAENTRGFGDVMGPVAVLSGVADVWLEAGVQPWDLAAPALILKEAGYAITDFSGRESLASGDALAASPATHAAVLAALNG